MPSTSRQFGYLPGLDGWRALGIVAILMAHDFAVGVGPLSTLRIRDYGHYGVHLFFAIAGLLLGMRLVEEEQVTGRIHWRAFWTRRALRIEPMVLLYLAAAAVLAWMGVQAAEPRRPLLSALLYYRNDVTGPPVFQYLLTGLLWPLCILVQFYILYWLVMVLARRHRLVVLGTLALAGELWLWVQQHTSFVGYLPDFRTDLNLHYLFWAALLGMLLQQGDWLRNAVRNYLQPWRVFSSTLALLLLCHAAGAFLLYPGHGFFPAHNKLFFGDIEVILLMMPLWLIATALHLTSWTTRLLELAPVRFLGRISFSLFLCHVPFFLARLVSGTPAHNFTPHWYTHAPWNFLLAVAIATVVHYAVELPAARLGRRLALEMS